jgi:hypothetical protein
MDSSPSSSPPSDPPVPFDVAPPKPRAPFDGIVAPPKRPPFKRIVVFTGLPAA